MALVNDPDRTPEAFVHKVMEGYAFGYYEVVTVNGREYDQVDMGNARNWVPSRLTGNRFPSEREADLEWYGEVERLIEKRRWWLVVDESKTQVERWDLLVRRDRGTPPPSKRATATAAMRDRFLGEPPGTEMLHRNADRTISRFRAGEFVGEPITTERVEKGIDRVLKSGKAGKMLRRYLGDIK